MYVLLFDVCIITKYSNDCDVMTGATAMAEDGVAAASLLVALCSVSMLPPEPSNLLSSATPALVTTLVTPNLCTATLDMVPRVGCMITSGCLLIQFSFEG